MNTRVYLIRNTKNGNCYIGSSVNYSRRKKRHIKDLETNKHHSIPLQRAWNKYGADSFEFSILEEFAFMGKEVALEREQYYINLIKPKYNVCLIAGSQFGLKRSEEFRRKCSERTKGKPTWNKGLKIGGQSDETKKKRSASLMGREVSYETRKKISFKHTGRKLTELHKLKLSKAKLKGTKNDKPITSVYPDGTSISYRSICEASRMSGVHVQTIYNSLNNKPTKYKWKKQTKANIRWILMPTGTTKPLPIREGGGGGGDKK